MIVCADGQFGEDDREQKLRFHDTSEFWRRLTQQHFMGRVIQIVLHRLATICSACQWLSQEMVVFRVTNTLVTWRR